MEGNDLWAQDALHLPLSPTRNLFPNPSFEQGVPLLALAGGRRSVFPLGGQTFCDRFDCRKIREKFICLQPGSVRSLRSDSFSLPGRKGQIYTISFYAKAEKPDASIRFALSSRKQGGHFPRSYTERCKPYPLTTEWKRFSTTFTSDGAPVAVVLGADGRRGKVWLDGIQYERGSKATEFVSSPLEGVLKTSHPTTTSNSEPRSGRNSRSPEKREPPVPREFTLMDFYKKVLWKKTLPVQAGKTVDLPFDSLGLAPGPGILRVRYTVPGTKPYYDFYRFSLIRSLKGPMRQKICTELCSSPRCSGPWIVWI